MQMNNADGEEFVLTQYRRVTDRQVAVVALVTRKPS